MSIPEAQLQTWSNQGADITAQTTHASIRRALEVYKWPTGMSYEPYLQGSYKNATNIYGNSDVDLVVELTSAFWSNLTQQEMLDMRLENANYDWDQFRRDVISALISYYGSNLVDTTGDKSIKVLPGSGRLKADVVVAGKYRYYENSRIRAEGITFWSMSTKQQIINYPKDHFNNGAAKNSDSRTQGRYRRSARMFKNARDCVIGQKPELAGKFPSYYLECLLYNTPDRCFRQTYQDTYADTLNWLNDQFNNDAVDRFECQNGMYYLFGPLSVQWNKPDARNLVSQLIALWNEW